MGQVGGVFGDTAFHTDPLGEVTARHCNWWLCFAVDVLHELMD